MRASIQLFAAVNMLLDYTRLFKAAHCVINPRIRDGLSFLATKGWKISSERGY